MQNSRPIHCLNWEIVWDKRKIMKSLKERKRKKTTKDEDKKEITLLYVFANAFIFTGPPLWSSGRSSWLQIQRSGYQIFWEVLGLKRGPFTLVSTTEKVLERKSSGSGPESQDCGRRDPSAWPHGTHYPQKMLALTSPTSDGRSIGIVHSRTQATEFFFLFAVEIYKRTILLNIERD
jgi:hypothetical protein